MREHNGTTYNGGVPIVNIEILEIYGNLKSIATFNLKCLMVQD